MLTAFVAALAIGVQAGESHCRVELFVDGAPQDGTSPITVALRFKMDDGWHIYWRNPGDSGAPPEVNWTLPKGWKASPFVWPKPAIHAAGGMTTFIFEHEAILTAQITPSGPSINHTIAAHVSWLVCQEACIPGSQKVSAVVPRTASPEARHVIEQALANAPKRLDSIVAVQSKQSVMLHFPPDLEPGAWTFLPNDDDVLDYNVPQKIVGQEGQQLMFVKSPLFKPTKKRLRGALVSADGHYIFDVPLKTSGDQQ